GMVTDVVVSSELQSQPRSDDDDVIAEAVWAAVVKLGAAEELDAFLMERAGSSGRLDWDWLYDRVVTDARSALDDVVADARYSFGLPKLPDSLPHWLAGALLDRIRDFF